MVKKSLRICTVSSVIIIIFLFGCGCDKEPDSAVDSERVNEESETEKASIDGVNTDLPEHIEDESVEDENVTVKYFKPRSGPGSGYEEGIPEDDIDGRSYLLATYDENGKLLSESFYDEKGEKCFGPEEWNDMIHRYEYTYDDNGNRTSVSDKGLDGEPVASYLPPGVHRWEWTYDDEGRRLSERMCYLNGNIRENIYDEEGELISEWCYKEDGQ
jgi:YD repeat-containing protein